MFRKVSQRGRRRMAAAFTLVELLVVVSIIALLIAILLPSLKKARQSAKRIACNANVRGIAQAGLTYAADDQNEFAIPVGPADGDLLNREAYTIYVAFGGKSGTGANNTTRGSLWSGGNRMGSIHRPLNFVLYKGGFGGASKGSGGGGRGGSSEDWTNDANLDLDIFRCPGDKGFSGMHQNGWKAAGTKAYDYYGTSYSCNPLLVGFSGANQPLESNSIYVRPMSRVPNPTNTVMYTEYASRYATWAANTEEYDQSGCFWGGGFYAERADMTAKGHHGQDFYFNVTFGDGHASWVKIKGHGRVEIGDQDKKMPPSCKGGVCNCIFLRGLNWQMDTLPAELVRTSKLRSGTGTSQIPGADGDDQSIFGVVDK